VQFIFFAHQNQFKNAIFFLFFLNSTLIFYNTFLLFSFKILNFARLFFEVIFD